MKNIYFCCRTSHEVRGLKYTLNEIRDMEEMSHLTRGAWIEIEKQGVLNKVYGSHLTRGAWIEIFEDVRQRQGQIVAPHTRCVD